MKTIKLLRYEEPVTRTALADDPTGAFATVETGYDIVVDDIKNAIIKGLAAVNKGSKVTTLDACLIWPIYQSFKQLPDSITSDIRVWQWLTIKIFHDFAQARIEMAFTSLQGNEDFKRVLGSDSLNGMNRQVLWKLFLAARALGDENLAKQACANQDMLVSIFERRIGQNDNIARALVQSVRSDGTTKIQKKITRINAIGQTRLLDYLDSNEVKAITSSMQ